MPKFKNTYNTGTVRLPGYDYGNNGAYFITICSHERQLLFSKIVNGEVVLTQLGEIIKSGLLDTPLLRQYVTIGEYVIMPNHIHAIVFIHHGSDSPEQLASEEIYSTLIQDDEYKNHFGPQSNNLASIIRGMKSTVSSGANKIGFITKVWQPGYHEHIVRNQEELIRIENYIRNNPYQWNSDENNPVNW